MTPLRKKQYCNSLQVFTRNRMLSMENTVMLIMNHRLDTHLRFHKKNREIRAGMLRTDMRCRAAKDVFIYIILLCLYSFPASV
jgi:hypothetical protein